VPRSVASTARAPATPLSDVSLIGISTTVRPDRTGALLLRSAQVADERWTALLPPPPGGTKTQ